MSGVQRGVGADQLRQDWRVLTLGLLLEQRGGGNREYIIQDGFRDSALHRLLLLGHLESLRSDLALDRYKDLLEHYLLLQNRRC